MDDNIRPFDDREVRAAIFRSRITQVGPHTFTDVTFAFRGEFFGCRYPGLVYLESERADFERRQRNRNWDRRG